MLRDPLNVLLCVVHFLCQTILVGGFQMFVDQIDEY